MLNLELINSINSTFLHAWLRSTIVARCVLSKKTNWKRSQDYSVNGMVCNIAKVTTISWQVRTFCVVKNGRLKLNDRTLKQSCFLLLVCYSCFLFTSITVLASKACISRLSNTLASPFMAPSRCSEAWALAMQSGDTILLVDTEHRLLHTIVGVTVPFYITFSNYDQRCVLRTLSFLCRRMTTRDGDKMSTLLRSNGHWNGTKH